MSDMREENIDDFLCNIQTRLSAARVAFALVLPLAWWMESERITAGRKRYGFSEVFVRSYRLYFILIPYWNRSQISIMCGGCGKVDERSNWRGLGQLYR